MLCTKCDEHEAVDGFRQCPKCREKAAEVHRNWRKKNGDEHRRKAAARQKARRARLATDPAAYAEYLAKHKEYNRRSLDRKKAERMTQSAIVVSPALGG